MKNFFSDAMTSSKIIAKVLKRKDRQTKLIYLK